MIEAISGKGVHRANVICDLCKRVEVVTCDYERISSRAGGWQPNEGQIIRKIEGQKWAVVKGAHHCPACEAKRKAASAKRPNPAINHQPAMKEPAMPVAIESKEPALRRPTPAQKRQIIGLLEDAYDDDAKRYRNPADTDKVIAETVGGGCPWGWVAEIREELFGPDTRNAELEALLAEVKRAEGQVGNLMGEARRLGDEISALRARLDKVA